MRWKWAIVMLLALPLAARAADNDRSAKNSATDSKANPRRGASADDDRNAQISAATANAVEGLRKQIADSKITDQITVKDLLDRTAGTQLLTDMLFTSEQIGGPRMVDDKTCQVRLAVSGSRVIQSLQQIAALYPKKSPLSADQLAVNLNLRGWEKKTFTATGSSAGATAVDVIKPGPEERLWITVSDASRKQAVYEAKHNATTQALTPVASVPIGGKTVGDAMALPPVSQRMQQWLDSRPITQVEFRDDQSVRVTLAAPAEDTFDQLRLSLADQNSIPMPKDETGWMSVKQDFVNKFKPPVGTAPATQPSTVLASRYPIPRKAPDWAQQQLDADASVKLKGSALMSARAAENTARENLKTKLEALPLGDGKTIGEAAKSDQKLREIVDKTVKDAGIRKTEYLSDGTTKVRVYLDLQNVWDIVSDAQ